MNACLKDRLIALILAVSLAVMGVAAASARGQTMVGGQALVHCSAGGLVQTTRDAAGHPTGGKHLCPDLVAGLFGAAAIAMSGAGAPGLVLLGAVAPSFAVLPAGAPRAAPQARGPPVLL